MQVDQLPAVKTVHRLLFRALLEIRSQSYEQRNNSVFHLANLFHNVVLEMENAARGECTYEDVLRFLEEQAKANRCETWLIHSVAQLQE